MRLRIPSAQVMLALAAALLALGWGTILARWHLEGDAAALERIEAPLTDLRFQIAGPRPPSEDIAIVAVDDDTVREAGTYPLPRLTVARLVREIARQRPRAIGLDLLFIDAGAPGSDLALADALREARAVVAAAAIFSRTEPHADRDEGRFAEAALAERVIWPVPPIRAAAGVGLVNIATDQAGTPRHVPLIVRTRDGLMPAFALRLISVAAGADPELGGDHVCSGPITTSYDLGYNLTLRFYGPSGAFRTVSASDVLAGTLPANALEDRIVIVGATAIGTADTFATPFDPVLPGVEVLATAVSHLIKGDALVRTTATRRLDAAAAVLLPVLTVLLLALRRIGVGLALAAALVAAWVALAVAAFMHGYWLHIAVPIAAVIPPALFYVAGRLWLDQRIERQLEATQQAFRRFHAPALADYLAAHPDYLAEPTQQDAGVLFVDLSGFTGLSESLGPEQTRDLLKGLHSVIEDEVTRHRGVVVSFMGDGAMIVFGLPRPAPDDAARAVAAVVALVERVHAWLRTLPARQRERIGVRVGAHFGPVVVSRLGTDTHQHITATGDTVNVASRLLEVAAAQGALAAASEDLFRASSLADSRFSDVRQVPIRGRAEPLRIRLLLAQPGIV